MEVIVKYNLGSILDEGNNTLTVKVYINSKPIINFDFVTFIKTSNENIYPKWEEGKFTPANSNNPYEIIQDLPKSFTTTKNVISKNEAFEFDDDIYNFLLLF